VNVVTIIIMIIIAIVAIYVGSFFNFFGLQIENIATLRTRYRTRNYLLLGSQKFIHVTTQAHCRTISSAGGNTQSYQYTFSHIHTVLHLDIIKVFLFTD
jgi:hypothetical protein